MHVDADVSDKYTPEQRAFARAIQVVVHGPSSLNAVAAALRRDDFPAACVVDDDKIYFGHSQDPVDVVRFG